MRTPGRGWRGLETIHGTIGETMDWVGHRVLELSDFKAALEHHLRHVCVYLRLVSNPGSSQTLSMLENTKKNKEPIRVQKSFQKNYLKTTTLE